MSALQLRKVDAAWARASRLLGSGVSLGFNAHGLAGELTLQPFADLPAHSADGTWLCTALGPVQISNPEALLNVWGELPVTLSGQHQPWYWQAINQRLSPPIAELFAPVEPLIDNTALPVTPISLRVQVRLGDQRVDGHLSAAADVLLRLLDAPCWQRHQCDLGEDWSITQPLILGQLALTLDQLSSLRPGDVLMPAHCLFDSEGSGRLPLAGRHWAVQTSSQEQQLYVRLCYEEDLEHEQ